MELRRVFDLLAYLQTLPPRKVVLAHKLGLKWEGYSTESFIAESNKVSAGLIDLGLKRGDRIALLTYQGSPYWNFLDFGMQQIGVIVVPVPPYLNQEQLGFILNDSKAKYCIVSNRELLEKAVPLKETCLHLKNIFTLEKLPDAPGWKKLSTEPTSKHMETIQSFKAAIHEDDPATLLYTNYSGQLKGVLLSHKNLIQSILMIKEAFPLRSGKKTFSFLPLSHLPERLLIFTYFLSGTPLYYSEHPDLPFNSLKELRPHYFSATPEFLEEYLNQLVELELSASSRRARFTRWGLNLGHRFLGGRQMPLGYWLKQIAADLLAFRRWRKLLGGRVEGLWIFSENAPAKLVRIFSAAGISIRTGFSMAETSGLIAANRFYEKGMKFGTAGQLLTNLKIKIDAPSTTETGEILVNAPTLMLGYHQQNAQKREWFRTGWLGKLEGQTFLNIRGQKKYQFQTSDGMTVLPSITETQLLESPFIRKCLVVGENRPFLSALIIPFFPLLKDWCKQ